MVKDNKFEIEDSDPVPDEDKMTDFTNVIRETVETGKLCSKYEHNPIQPLRSYGSAWL